MVVPGFFSHRLFAGIACVKNHLNLKGDSADWRPVLRNPYGSGVLSQFTSFWDIESEGRRLRLTCPEERVSSFDEDKSFDFDVEGKGRADRGVQDQGPMAAFLGFGIKLPCSRIRLPPGFWGV
jgi:hypothetical protein